MPFLSPVPIWGRSRASGAGIPKTTRGIRTGGAGSQPASHVGRSPAPVQKTAAATDSVLLYSDQKSLGTTLTQGNVTVLPQTDIIEVDLNFSATNTGSVSATDVASYIDHIEIYDGDSGQLKMMIPGGTYLYDHLVRFYPVRGAYVSQGSALANTVASNSGTAAAVLRIPVRIPGTTTAPCKMTIFYTTLASLGTETSVAVTNNIYVKFGECEGKWMRVAYQSVTLASGLNFLNQLAVPSNALMSELFLRQNTITTISWVQVFTNGTAVMPYQEEAVINARDAADFGSALQTKTLALNLGTQWAVNSTSYLMVNTSGAMTAEQLVWVWFE